jgi:ribonuclease P protein component
VALPRRYRLTSSKEFSQVYKEGQQASTSHLVVKFMESPGGQPSLECSRFGITISQKVSKRAVVRNRLKRQVRAALQTLIPKLRQDLWVVIVLRRSAIECDYWQFLQELEELFTELEVRDGY